MSTLPNTLIFGDKLQTAHPHCETLHQAGFTDWSSQQQVESGETSRLSRVLGTLSRQENSTVPRRPDIAKEIQLILPTARYPRNRTNILKHRALPLDLQAKQKERRRYTILYL